MNNLHRGLRHVAATLCLSGAAAPVLAATPPTIESRILAQAGLDATLTLNLLENQIGIIGNYNKSTPTCTKLPSAGSVMTISETMTSKTQYKSSIDFYFDTACKKPYVEADVMTTISNTTETFTVDETAHYLRPDGTALGTLKISEVLSVTNKIETLRGLGTFTPTGPQPVADLGYTCSDPTTGNTKTLTCQAGVAQTFSSLGMSLASLVPFTITAASNANSPSVKLAGSTSNLRTGPAGSLSITAPSANTLAIGGGGTAYASTTLAGSEAHITLLPPKPTTTTVTDSNHDAKFSFKVLNNTTRTAHAAITTITPTPVKTLGAIALDESGSGKVTYSDGHNALVSNFLVAD